MLLTDNPVAVSFPTSGGGFGGDCGVTIPTGDPDALRQAGDGWDALAEHFDDQVATLSSTSGTVTGADWNGAASQSYGSASLRLGFLYGDAATACRSAASACRTFATALKAAQDAAKTARSAAIHAQEDGRAAEGRHTTAVGRATSAQASVAQANASAAAADLAGPVGLPAAASARATGAAAAQTLATAQHDAGVASQEMGHAATALSNARAAGTRASDDADDAARTAATAFEHAAGAARPPDGAAVPAVPVTVSDRGRDPLTGLPPAAAFGQQFRRTPSDVRREQIQQIEAMEEAARPKEGGIADRFGGEFKGLTGIRAFGDPTTKGFQRGEKFGALAALFPTPGSLLRDGERLTVREGERLLLKQGERESGRSAARAGADTGYHYTRRQFADLIEKRGLQPSSYLTDRGDLSPLQAQIDLALPPNRALPGTVIRVDLRAMREAGYEVGDFVQVARKFNMPGGGQEVRVKSSIPPRFLKVVRR